MNKYFGLQFPALSSELTAYYLALLQLSQEAPSIEYLTQLIDAHVRTIPWENHDLFYRQHIELDIENLIKQYNPKIKGGLCYQVNATFFALLYSLGFQINFHPAMVYGYRNLTYKKPRLTHAVPRVKINDSDYLADVTWGGLNVPLSLNQINSDFNLAIYQGQWGIFYTSEGMETLQYIVYDRNLSENDVQAFINYDTASEEREVAHRPMFYLFREGDRTLQPSNV